MNEVREQGLQTPGGKSSSDRWNSKCKGPEVRLILGYLRNTKKASVVGAEGERGPELLVSNQ